MVLPLPPQIPGKPLVGNALDFRRDPVALISRGYEMFGPVFSIRLGRRRAVILLGADNHRFFFTQTDKILSTAEVYKAFVPLFGDGFSLAAPPAEYAEQRAIIQTAFSGKRMEDYLGVMIEETRAWVDTLGEKGEFELVSAIERLTLNIVATAIMGQAFRNHMGERFWALYRDVIKGLDFVLPPNLPIARFRRRDRARNQLREKIGELLIERRQQPNGHGDFVERLAQARYSTGQLVPVETLQSMIMFLVFSASESTPLQASWSMIQLLQHPLYVEKVLQEQTEVLANNLENLNLDSIQKLYRLQWALKETERIRPMITMLWRYNLQSYEIGGYRIPAGWSTVICPPVSHRLSEGFREPGQYDPERFSAERMEDRPGSYALAGFGGGSHKCPGMNFAHNLMKTIFSGLLQKYDLELMNPDPQPDFSASITRPEETGVRYVRRTSSRAASQRLA